MLPGVPIPRKCPLTGYDFGDYVKFNDVNAAIVDYEFSPIGRARIAHLTFIYLQGSSLDERKPILAGICRDYHEHSSEPPVIDAAFIQASYQKYPSPFPWKAKAHHFLKLLYETGDQGIKERRQLSSAGDEPMMFAEDSEEFKRLMTYLEEEGWLQWQDKSVVARGVTNYFKVRLTSAGRERVEKELPQVPMIGLVGQEIATGNLEVDRRINHAKGLFFQEPHTLELYCSISVLRFFGYTQTTANFRVSRDWRAFLCSAILRKKFRIRSAKTANDGV